jgi:hypothetical protein
MSYPHNIFVEEKIIAFCNFFYRNFYFLHHDNVIFSILLRNIDTYLQMVSA